MADPKSKEAEHKTKIRSAKTKPIEVDMGGTKRWVYREVCAVYLEQDADVDMLAQFMAGGYEFVTQFTLPSGVPVALVKGMPESKIQGLSA